MNMNMKDSIPDHPTIESWIVIERYCSVGAAALLHEYGLPDWGYIMVVRELERPVWSQNGCLLPLLLVFGFRLPHSFGASQQHHLQWLLDIMYIWMFDKLLTAIAIWCSVVQRIADHCSLLLFEWHKRLWEKGFLEVCTCIGTYFADRRLLHKRECSGGRVLPIGCISGKNGCCLTYLL